MNSQALPSHSLQKNVKRISWIVQNACWMSHFRPKPTHTWKAIYPPPKKSLFMCLNWALERQDRDTSRLILMSSDGRLVYEQVSLWCMCKFLFGIFCWLFCLHSYDSQFVPADYLQILTTVCTRGSMSISCTWCMPGWILQISSSSHCCIIYLWALCEVMQNNEVSKHAWEWLQITIIWQVTTSSCCSCCCNLSMLCSPTLFCCCVYTCSSCRQTHLHPLLSALLTFHFHLADVIPPLSPCNHCHSWHGRVMHVPASKNNAWTFEGWWTVFSGKFWDLFGWITQPAFGVGSSAKIPKVAQKINWSFEWTYVDHSEWASNAKYQPALCLWWKEMVWNGGQGSLITAMYTGIHWPVFYIHATEHGITSVIIVDFYEAHIEAGDKNKRRMKCWTWSSSTLITWDCISFCFAFTGNEVSCLAYLTSSFAGIYGHVMFLNKKQSQSLGPNNLPQ